MKEKIITEVVFLEHGEIQLSIIDGYLSEGWQIKQMHHTIVYLGTKASESMSITVWLQKP